MLQDEPTTRLSLEKLRDGQVGGLKMGVGEQKLCGDDSEILSMSLSKSRNVDLPAQLVKIFTSSTGKKFTSPAGKNAQVDNLKMTGTGRRQVEVQGVRDEVQMKVTNTERLDTLQQDQQRDHARGDNIQGDHTQHQSDP